MVKERRYSEIREGDVVRGEIRSLADYGAFVDLGGVDGLLHVGEISWSRVNKPSDVLSVGQQIEAKVLKIDSDKRRISLSMKQLQPHPWESLSDKYRPGERAGGMVTRVSEISPEKRINHPRDVLRVGQVVKAQVLAIDKEKRQMRLSMKQLVPSSLDEYIAEHKEGDVVTGRVMEASGKEARVELGEGIQATCRVSGAVAPKQESQVTGGADLSALTSMLSARWKGGAT